MERIGGNSSLLQTVERVVRLVEITPLPEAPETVLCVINVQGRIVPALSLRRCLHLPERELRLSDQLIIASIAQRTVALVADAVIDVVEPTERAVSLAPAILSDIVQVDGVVKLADALVPLLNLDALFPPDAAGALPPHDMARKWVALPIIKCCFPRAPGEENSQGGPPDWL